MLLSTEENSNIRNDNHKIIYGILDLPSYLDYLFTVENRKPIVFYLKLVFIEPPSETLTLLSWCSYICLIMNIRDQDYDVDMTLTWCWHNIDILLTRCLDGIDVMLTWCRHYVDVVVTWCLHGADIMWTWCWHDGDMVLNDRIVTWCWHAVDVACQLTLALLSSLKVISSYYLCSNSFSLYSYMYIPRLLFFRK
jgi:hypothetical protein